MRYRTSRYGDSKVRTGEGIANATDETTLEIPYRDGNKGPRRMIEDRPRHTIVGTLEHR